MANSLAVILRRTTVQLPKHFFGLAAPCLQDTQSKKQVPSNVLWNRKLCIFTVRTLYTPSGLGVDNFVEQKKKVKNQFASISDKFISKMKEFTSDETQGMVFTEDLKNMIHLAETDEHIDLVVKMIKRYV